MRSKESRRRKRLRLIARAVVWILLIAIEMVIALVPTAILAAITIPMAYAERGYPAIGGEWLIIILAYCGTFKAIHTITCSQIFKEA